MMTVVEPLLYLLGGMTAVITVLWIWLRWIDKKDRDEWEEDDG